MMDFQPRRLLVSTGWKERHYRPGCLKNLEQFIHGMALIDC